MKITKKIDLINQIVPILRNKYTLTQIYEIYKSHKIDLPGVDDFISYYTADEPLLSTNEKVIEALADELEIGKEGTTEQATKPPRIWSDTGDFKLFISHLALNKSIAIKLKDNFKQYNISGFVAHEDINPTLEWQIEIEKALNSMDALLAVHTTGFAKSHWAQQEVGFALGSGVKIISFKITEDPLGFISKHQAVSWRKRKAPAVAKEVFEILKTAPETKERLKEVGELKRKKAEEEEIPF